MSDCGMFVVASGKALCFHTVNSALAHRHTHTHMYMHTGHRLTHRC